MASPRVAAGQTAHDQVAITLAYKRPGTQPPVFVAGDFSDPAWQPQEMECETIHGQHAFHKVIQVARGSEVQYKFRIGTGDWWVLDDEHETVSDGCGNLNSLLKVPASVQSDHFKPEDDFSDDEDRLEPVFSHEMPGAVEPSRPHDTSEVIEPVFSHEVPVPVEDSEDVKDSRSDTAVTRESTDNDAVEIIDDTGIITNASMGAGLPSHSPNSKVINGQTIGHSQAKGPTEEDIDHNDPTLEHFPSGTRDEILQTLRRIQTEAPADHVVSEPSQVPEVTWTRSPVASRRTSTIAALSESRPATEHQNQPVDQPERSSLHQDSDRLRPMASLQSIAEEGLDDQRSISTIQRTGSVERSVAGEVASSDEDEGIANGCSSATSPSRWIPSRNQRDWDHQKRSIGKIPNAPGDANNNSSVDTARSKNNETGLLRRRDVRQPSDRPTTSHSMQSIHSIHEANKKNGNWLMTFLHSVFVDCIGGFFSRLFGGGRREAIITIGAVTVVGYVMNYRAHQVASPVLD